MKKLLVIAVILCALQFKITTVNGQQSSSVSQHNVSPERRALGQTKMMTQYLKLSEETSMIVFGINLRYEFISDSLKAILLDQTQKREAFNLYRDRKNEALKAALTPEQYKEWDNFRESARNTAKEVQHQQNKVKQ